MNLPFSKKPNLSKKTKKFVKSLGIQKPLYELTPQEARQFLRNLQSRSHKEIEAEVEDKIISTTTAGNVDVRIVRPKNSTEQLPAIIYVHGGGWIMGDKDVFDMLVRTIATKTKSAVFFINYTPSPEVEYPVAINQTYGVLNYIHNHSNEFNINTDKIAIAGDSAGGNMAIATAMKAKDENGPKLIFMLLFYPVTSADMNTTSYKEFQNGPWLTKRAMEWFWDAYAPDKETRESIYVSPLKARPADLVGLPSTLIITDENDVLRDEGEEFARKLDEADVEVSNIRINNTHHDFIMLNALANTEEAKWAIEFACKKLNEVLHY